MTDPIYAYTKTGSTYPGYVNAKRNEDGSVVLTVRGDMKDGGGQTAVLSMSEYEWGQFVFAGWLDHDLRTKDLGRPVPMHGSGPDNL